MWGKTIIQAFHTTQNYKAAVGEVVAEMLWPTRCVSCGTLGDVLCDNCFLKLRFIDQWRACPVCGAAYGIHQCCECNSFSLQSLGRTKVPFDQCVSAVLFDDVAASIARMRKDANERRLARVMAFCIANAIPPAWLTEKPLVSSIPSTARALRERGFDHGAELAESVAHLLRLDSGKILVGSHASDQRELGRFGRARNAVGRFSVGTRDLPSAIILVDDVFTTGATVMAACDTLKAAGVDHTYVATFARVT